MNHIAPVSISKRHIDIQRVLATKNIKLPNWLTGMFERLLHLDEINHSLYVHRDKVGLDLVNALLDTPRPDGLGIKVSVVNPENLPQGGNPIIAGNHPLGGPDGLALMRAIGTYRNDIKFPVNDFLLHIPGLAPLFIPIDKVHRNASNSRTLEHAFSENNALLYFPAGICSRKHKDGTIRDREWKPTFIKKAVKYQRDVVPFFFDAMNRKRFYNIAHLRESVGIKFNFEMALLPAEMFAQSGKTLRLVVGRPIPYTTFDQRHSAKEWAQLVQNHVYQLKEDPTTEFSHSAT